MLADLFPVALLDKCKEHPLKPAGVIMTLCGRNARPSRLVRIADAEIIPFKIIWIYSK